MIARSYFVPPLPNSEVPARPRCPTRGRNGFWSRRVRCVFGLTCSAPGMTSWLPSLAYLALGAGRGFSVPGMTNCCPAGVRSTLKRCPTIARLPTRRPCPEANHAAGVTTIGETRQ